MPALEIPTELFSFADQLNQTLRRLKQYRTEAEWVSALLDGISRFVDAAAVFALENNQLRLRGSYRFELPENLAFALNSGRAFETALETKDTVVALRSPAEVSSHLCTPDPAGADPLDRAVLIPLLNGSRIAAVLFAAARLAGQSPALELVAGMASIVLERRVNASVNVQIAPVADRPAPASPLVPQLPYWAGLDEEQRRLHLRAKRFSRVKVAEMQLFQPEACRSGREQNNVYLFLKKDIDAARGSYRDQFMARPGMDDYLHLELVRVAAGGDESKLGADYPGHMG